MVTGYIACGGNQGAVLEQFRRAVQGLAAAGVHVLKTSALYRTRPQGDREQPDFINGVIAVASEHSAAEMLTLLQRLEHAGGRQPGSPGGPRPLDLDLLFWGTERIATDRLTVPHPRWRQRDFVTVPLAEVMSAGEREYWGWPEEPEFKGIYEMVSGQGKWL